MDKLDNKKQNLTSTQTGVIMMVVTFIGFFFGFGREIALSSYFGTTYVMDAYNIASAIPGILFGGLFGAIGTAYMPTFSRITELEGIDEGKKFTDKLVTLLIIVALACTIVGIVFSDFLVRLIAPGFSGETAKLASRFLKIIFCYSAFAGVSGILDSYLRYNRVFIRIIVIAYVNDIAVIIGAIFAAYFGYIYLAIGFLLGNVGNCLFKVILAMKHGYSYRCDFKLGEPIKEIVALSVPVFIGSSLSQVNTLIDKFLASGLPEGSIAALGYGNIIPASLVALSSSIIATMMYPKISKAANTGEIDYLNQMSKKSMTIAVMIVLPFSLGTMAFSNQITQVVFERGAFSTTSTSLTASATLFYAIGMIFIAINAVSTNISYSIKDMKLPLICSVASICTNIGLNLLLIGPMKHNGLAFATSIAAFVSSVLIVFLLRRRHPELKAFPSKIKLARITFCAVLAIVFAIGAYRLISTICMIRTINLIISVGLSIIAYLLALKIAKIEEIDIIMDLIPKKNK